MMVRVSDSQIKKSPWVIFSQFSLSALLQFSVTVLFTGWVVAKTIRPASTTNPRKNERIKVFFHIMRRFEI